MELFFHIVGTDKSGTLRSSDGSSIDKKKQLNLKKLRQQSISLNVCLARCKVGNWNIKINKTLDAQGVKPQYNGIF
jgi:hypothetical protein